MSTQLIETKYSDITTCYLVPKSEYGGLWEYLSEIKARFQNDPSIKPQLDDEMTRTLNESLPEPPVAEWQAKLSKLWSRYRSE